MGDQNVQRIMGFYQSTYGQESCGISFSSGNDHRMDVGRRAGGNCGMLIDGSRSHGSAGGDYLCRRIRGDHLRTVRRRVLPLRSRYVRNTKIKCRIQRKVVVLFLYPAFFSAISSVRLTCLPGQSLTGRWKTSAMDYMTDVSVSFILLRIISGAFFFRFTF